MTTICNKLITCLVVRRVNDKIDFSVPEGSGFRMCGTSLLQMTCFCKRLVLKRFLPTVEMTRPTLAEWGRGIGRKAPDSPPPKSTHGRGHLPVGMPMARPKNVAKQVLPGEIYYALSFYFEVSSEIWESESIKINLIPLIINSF